MQISTLPRRPLIIDPDPDSAEKFKSDPRAQKLPPLIASTGRDAQLLLSDNNRAFAGIFINPEISRPGGLSVIRCAHQFHPVTPKFLICENSTPFSSKELNSLGIQKVLQKPLSYSQIIALVGPLISVFDPNDALAVAKQNTDILNQEIDSQDSQFTPIRANHFLAGSISFFDVYIRLRSGRYVKLLQAGDSFSPDRLTTYLRKGVTHFYLRKEAQQQYLIYCERLTSALLADENIPVEIKISQTLNQGEETLKFFHSQGISDSNLQFASRFVKNVNELLRQVKPKKYPFLQDFLNNVAAYEHGTATAVIASLLLRPLQITSLDPAETVGLASLLHDIGLLSLPEDLWHEDESKMSDAQKQIYRKHPSLGTDLVKSVTGLKPAAVQAIEQHHERRNRKGFPYQLGSGSISLVSEIVGISDEFAHIIQRMNASSGVSLQNELNLHIYGAFSANLIAEFNNAFGPMIGAKTN